MITTSRDIFIIIPAFNESKVIRETLSPLIMEGFSIVLVDDGSKEDVLPLVKDLDIFIIRHAINLGQGAALQTGTSFALKRGAKFIVHFDADGQHSPEDINVLLQPILKNEADIVLGSRFLNRQDYLAIPFLRRRLLRIARVVNLLFTGLWLTDAHNGFRALNSKAAHLLELTEDRMAHATELLQLIQYHKLKYKECPTHISYTKYSRNKGQSSLNSFSILIDLILKKIGA